MLLSFLHQYKIKKDGTKKSLFSKKVLWKTIQFS